MFIFVHICRSTNAAKRVDLSTAQNSSGQVLTESRHKCISSRSSDQNVPFSFVLCSRLQRSTKRLGAHSHAIVLTYCVSALIRDKTLHYVTNTSKQRVTRLYDFQNTEKTMEHS